MAINVADNFSYKGGKPLDARTKYATVADMVAIPAADLYDGCLAYVTATKKNYQYDSTNETDPTLGKWRELQTGGGGGTDYTAGEGIDITNDVISTKQSEEGDIDEIVDVYPSGGNIAVTGYVPLGTLIPYYGETVPKFFLACDGATYNKADYPELANHLLSLTNHSQYVVDGDDTKFKVPDLRGEFIRGTGTNSHTNQGSGANVGVHQDGTQIPLLNITEEGSSRYIGGQFTNYSLYSPENYGYDWLSEPTEQNTWAKSDGKNTTSYVGRAITRPTNTSVLFCIAYKDIYSNPMNDYSTTEKVVGTWVDGKPIYQRTYNIGTLNLGTTWASPTLDFTIDRIINAIGCGDGVDTYNADAGAVVFPVHGIGSFTYDLSVKASKENNKFVVYSSAGNITQILNAYLTVQYTKATT